MGWSGGTFSRVHDWTTDAGSAINIEADRMDAEDDNFATGIDTCLHKSGQNAATGNLPMGGNRHTGVGNSDALDDYASSEDVIDQHLTYYVDSGAADAYVITPDPAITAYAEGQRFVFRAANANTGASTLNINALGATAIQTNDGSALAANMIVVGGYYEVTYDANGSRFVLTSPHSLTPANDSVTLTAGNGLTGGGDLSANRTFAVGAGTGITVNADDIATNDSAIVHDNLSGFVANEHVDHSAVSLTAGNGLTGGGDLTATRNFAVGAGDGIAVAADAVAVDISGLTAIEGNALASTDGYLVDDAGAMKRMAHSDAGVPVQTVTDTTDTLGTADMNTFIEYDNASAITVTLNTGTGKVGNAVLIKQSGAGQVTVSGTATLETANGAKTFAQHSVIVLLCIATDTWSLYGDSTS